MLKTLLTPFGLDSNDKFSSNFLTAFAMSIYFILIYLGVISLPNHETILVILVKVSVIGINLLNLISLAILKLKIRVILEIHEELILAYSGLKNDRGEHFHMDIYSPILWLLIYVPAFGLLLWAVFNFELDDIIFDMYTRVLFPYHGTIALFYLTGWPFTMFYVYCELNIRYIYVLETYWRRLNCIYIKPSYLLVLEIRDSLTKLKLSKNNLANSVNIILFFAICMFACASLFVFTYIMYLPIKYPGFIQAWYFLYFFSLAHFVLACLHIKLKSKVQDKIENKLSNWDY